MKIFVVGGGGTLGSSAAFLLAQKFLADEIVLYDLSADLATHHAMDIHQAASLLSGTKLRSGAWNDLEGADLVVLAAGIPFDRQTGRHMQDVLFLLPLLREFTSALVEFAPKAVVLTMSNPVDAINYWLYKLSGLPASRFLGFSYNDVIRARWGIAQILNVPVADVSCGVVGEHGKSKVPLFSAARVFGEPAMLTQAQIEEISALNTAWWSDFLALGVHRTAGWTSAVGLATVVEHMVGIQKGEVSCSCILEGALGLHDLSIGVEAELDIQGVKKILPLNANAEEEIAFMNSVHVVQEKIAILGEHL